MRDLVICVTVLEGCQLYMSFSYRPNIYLINIIVGADNAVRDFDLVHEFVMNELKPDMNLRNDMFAIVGPLTFDITRKYTYHQLTNNEHIPIIKHDRSFKQYHRKAEELIHKMIENKRIIRPEIADRSKLINFIRSQTGLTAPSCNVSDVEMNKICDDFIELLKINNL